MKCPSCPRILQWTDGAFCAECMKPAPSPRPEMPEGWEYVAEHSIFVFTSRSQVRHMLPLTRMRELLATQGLHVITAEQKAVLDAREALR